MDIALTLNDASGQPLDFSKYKGVRFSLRQGRRLLIRDKWAVIESGKAMIPLNASETRRMRPGPMILEVRTIDLNDGSSVFPPFVLEARSSLIG
jgi:hypothetical protein